MAENNYLKNARQDALLKKENEEYKKSLEQERIENEAPRKALSDAYDYVKNKFSGMGESATKFAKESLGFKHGGATTCKMSTHVPKKNANW
jgi:hypothetical protein